MIGEQGLQLPAKRLGYLLQFSIGHSRHAVTVKGHRVAHEDAGKTDDDVDGGCSVLPLSVAFLQLTRACESAILLPSLSETFPPLTWLRSRGAFFSSDRPSTAPETRLSAVADRPASRVRQERSRRRCRKSGAFEFGEGDCILPGMADAQSVCAGLCPHSCNRSFGSGLV